MPKVTGLAMTARVAQGFFITGTDTEVGKTFIACQLLNRLAAQGHKTVALKPVASGCNDAVLLNQCATEKSPLEHTNPFYFDQPIAPSIAANQKRLNLNVADIYSACQPVLQYPADYIIIEGAGGWKVPLNATETMADLAEALGYPVILVVAIRLGCINHAILSAESIRRSNLKFAGWVANIIDKRTTHAEKIIDTIQTYIGEPVGATCGRPV